MLRDFFSTGKPTQVDELIETVTAEMKEYGPNEPEYNSHLEKLERLYVLKAEDKPKPVSLDTILQVGGHLFGILIIVFVEKGHVLPPNAMKQIGRSMR